MSAWGSGGQESVEVAGAAGDGGGEAAHRVERDHHRDLGDLGRFGDLGQHGLLGQHGAVAAGALAGDPVGEQATSELSSLLRQVSLQSTREVDRLIEDLKLLREKLEDQAVKQTELDRNVTQKKLELMRQLQGKLAGVGRTDDTLDTQIRSLEALVAEWAAANPKQKRPAALNVVRT